jgi:ribonuclease HI
MSDDADFFSKQLLALQEIERATADRLIRRYGQLLDRDVASCRTVMTATDLVRSMHALIAQVQREELAKKKRALPETTPEAAAVSAEAPAPKVARTSSKSDTLVIYTDGACLDNGTPRARAGFGVACSDRLNMWGKVPGRATNQRAELFAGIVALTAARDVDCVEIKTDSEYLCLSISDPSRLQTWARNGWKTKAKTTVANCDLWRPVVSLLSERAQMKMSKVVFTHVKGHSGIPGNELADELAEDGAKGDELFATNSPGPRVNVIRAFLDNLAPH